MSGCLKTSDSPQKHLQACLGQLGHAGPGQAGHLQHELGQSGQQTAQGEAEHHCQELGHQADMRKRVVTWSLTGMALALALAGIGGLCQRISKIAQ